MSVSSKLLWCGFASVVLMLVLGVAYRIKILVVIGYAFGFPFLLVPLMALAAWSERRKARGKKRGGRESGD